jgi:hypothetical protein
LEFIDSKFVYAVEVDTTDGFELCPAENCSVESNCPTSFDEKFRILKDFKLDNIYLYEDFLIKMISALLALKLLLMIKEKFGPTMSTQILITILRQNMQQIQALH